MNKMNKAVFLDRDGVVNEVLTNRVHFVNKPEDFYLLNGVGEAVSLLNRSGYQVFVVTNQGGIGLGYMSEKMLLKIHDKMVREIGRKGGYITDIMYCPHAPKEGCSCRKPNPKMILDLAEQYQVDLNKSYMIGDRDVDITAGKNAGVQTVLIGGRDPAADFCFRTLLEAVRFIVEKN